MAKNKYEARNITMVPDGPGASSFTVKYEFWVSDSFIKDWEVPFPYGVSNIDVHKKVKSSLRNQADKFEIEDDQRIEL